MQQQQKPGHKTHQSLPSLTFSIASSEINSHPSSPLTSTFNHIYQQKRNSEPMPSRRWDDSQLEMELAEDDLMDTKTHRRHSSLRFKRKLLPSENYFNKFRRSPSSNNNSLLKKISNWFS
ncbi:hypothetical protein G6F56_010381 [Rhizopus delemar]|nr:hypothetical protein G6F56_010381 [Rhizopus delemar]